jgi:hypothetical protein
MLTALLDGHQRAAGELAIAANVSAQSASMHLAQLLDGGLLAVSRSGRNRFYRLSKPEVANALEALGAISTARRYIPSGANQELCYARTCYDHLAGELGVRLTDTFLRKGMLRPKGEREFQLLPPGEALLQKWEIDLSQLRQSRRCLARRCMDWTERREHLAGAVGAALCQRFLDLRWVQRQPRSRALHVSAQGERALQRFFA